MEIQGYCEICRDTKFSKWSWEKLNLLDNNGKSAYGRAVQTHICENCKERM